MSIVVFPGLPGRVTVLRGHSSSQASLPPLVKLAGSGPFSPGNAPAFNNSDALAFNVTRTIVTRLQISKQTNHQFLHTLGGDIHVYVFGDRMGHLVISGIAAAVSCASAATCNPFTSPGGSSSNYDTEHGLERLLDYYDDMRLSNNPYPLRVFIGRRTLVRGFLTSFSADTADIEQRLIQFSLGLNLLPE